MKRVYKIIVLTALLVVILAAMTVFANATELKTGSGIVTRGPATLTISGTNTFAGKLTVEAGTVVLASDTALPANAPVALSGGTVTCGGVTNSTGALTLAGDATLSLGDGALAFADSSDEAWTAGATLTVTGDGPLPTRALRFGTSSSGLTGRQAKQVTYNGEPVLLDAQGYLRHAGGMMISIY